MFIEGYYYPMSDEGGESPLWFILALIAFAAVIILPILYIEFRDWRKRKQAR